jgi:hypothetical protein
VDLRRLAEAADQCGANPNMRGQHDPGVPERLSEQGRAGCAAVAVGAAERAAAEVLASGAAVPSRGSRMFNQFVECTITVSGWRKLDPRVLAITFASAVVLSSAASRVYRLMPLRPKMPTNSLVPALEQLLDHAGDQCRDRNERGTLTARAFEDRPGLQLERADLDGAGAPHLRPGARVGDLLPALRLDEHIARSARVAIATAEPAVAHHLLEALLLLEPVGLREQAFYLAAFVKRRFAAGGIRLGPDCLIARAASSRSCSMLMWHSLTRVASHYVSADAFDVDDVP